MTSPPTKQEAAHDREGSSGAPVTLLRSAAATRRQGLARLAGESGLLLVTFVSVFAVLFIFYFVTRDAFPFFRLRGLREFFTGTQWYPAATPPSFGVVSIFYGSAMVTIGSSLVAVPLGVTAAICLSDVLPFRLRQMIKPVIEMLAAIPSVAYGFFALVVFAPLLQDHGDRLLGLGLWAIGLPTAVILCFVLSGMISSGPATRTRRGLQALVFSVGIAAAAWLLHHGTQMLAGVRIDSGTNALNASIILGIMALPTVVSVSEDALQAVSREIREGSYALGATRAETLLRVVLPAAGSGICAASVLGIMRALGETMVVWMASGNSARIPTPWYNVLASVRTLTATIAGDMGEADHVTGSARYHVLFAMAFCLLLFSFILNLISEGAVRRTARKTGKL